MDYSVAFWNLENLFAPEGFPGREPWVADAMARDLRGWSEALFERKVSQLATGIAAINGGDGPDLLGVCEVENDFCLNALAAAVNARFPGRRYAVVHVDSTHDGRGIDTAFLFDAERLQAVPGELFSHFVMRRTGTRDITQQTFRTAAGNEMVVFANHWPSRSGGHHTLSQGFRATAGETLAYWHERVREVKGTDTAVLAIGDFNDEPADPSVSIHANASRERDDIELSLSARFYNLAWNYLRFDAVDERNEPRTLYGTLYWDGNGNVFDQILASRSLLKGEGGFTVREETAGVHTLPAMVDRSKNRGAIRFGLPDGDAAPNVNPDGFSDHFPVAVLVSEG